MEKFYEKRYTHAMASMDKKELEHLASLARLELSPGEEDKLLKDFEGILNHFNELKELPARPASPPTGGKPKRVVLREDGDTQPDHFANQQGIVDAFPEKEGSLLKVPPVFE